MIAPLMAVAVLCLAAAPAASELHPNKQLSSYRFDPAAPLAERVELMSPERLKQWEQFDEATGYKAYMPTASEKKELASVLDALPSGMRKVLEERLIAFYFIEGLKGNGLTDWVLDNQKSVYSFIVLNSSCFHKSLSQLLSERDRSAFKGAADVSVDAGRQDSGVLYAAVHEAFHAYDYSARVTPYTDDGMAEALGLPLKATWQVWQDYSRPQAASDYPLRKLLRFYGFDGPNLDAAQAPKVYRQLKGSPFVSLYGSRSWAEDASELFFFHHLTQTLGRPYRIIYRGASEVLEPMSNQRVRSRAAQVAAAVGP